MLLFEIRILPEFIKGKDNKKDYWITGINDYDLIEYLRNIYYKGNIYIPN